MFGINTEGKCAELGLISGGRFRKYLESAQRSLNQGSLYFRENPLAWSIQILKRQLKEKTLNINQRTLVAIGFLQSYRDILSRWRSHPNFPELSKELCSYFYHSLILLIASNSLTDAGNRIAVKVIDNDDNERSADLYIRLSGTDTLHIEVKAPQAFEWTESNIPPCKIRKTIEKCLKRSRGQINNLKPGVLVIGSTCLDVGFCDQLERIASKVLHKHRQSYRSIAAISLVSLKEVSLSRRIRHSFGSSTEFEIRVVLNEFYGSENPVIKKA